MNHSEALDVLRSLNLPTPRRVELIRQATAIRDPTELERHLFRARAEVARNREARQESFQQEMADRDAYAALVVAEPSTEPQDAPGRRRPENVGIPLEARPVTVRWTVPTKPDAIRVQHRPEEIGSNRRASRSYPARPIKHGTLYGYVKRGCREDCPGNADGLTCREASAAENVRKRIARRERQAQEKSSLDLGHTPQLDV